MDPLSALSLAGNILQFIELGGKIVSGTLEMYESATGSTVDNEILWDTTERLQGLTRDLRSSKVNGTTKAERNIQDLSIKCEDVARELIDLLKYIRANNPGKKFDSLVSAYRTLRKSSEVEKLALRLDKLQSQLSLHLLDALNNAQSEISRELAMLRSQCRRLDLDRADQITQTRDDLLAAINQIQVTAPSWLNFNDARSQSIKIQGVSTSITAAITSTRDIQLEARVLQSIKFPSINQRADDIHDAHQQTFGWILESDSSSANVSVHFQNWLQHESGLFWVRGKPGSGKSTLMKFVSTHPDTRNFLKSWAEGQKLVIASYYFWNAGNKLQKSQEGLVRCLLFEVLRKCPEIILPIWSILSDGDIGVEPITWRFHDLVEAFTQTIEQLQLKAKFCFFIDGLDEYDGTDHASLIRLIRSISHGEQAKFCVSSRPWNEFEEAFGQDLDRVLRLEAHTADDIRAYVQSMFEENVHYQKIKAVDGRYTQLTQQIMQRADGVFLWVFLAVRSLLKGMTNADSVAKLEIRLKILPPTLDEFFRQMLESVEQEYRQESSEMILTALEAESPLDVMIYSVLDDELDLESIANVSRVSEQEIIARSEIMNKRINARSKGILEVKYNTSEGPFFSQRVEFLHRTARDFLSTLDMRQLLNDNERRQILIAQKLVRAFLAAITLVPEEELWTSTDQCISLILHNILWNAERWERLTGTAIAAELDECEKLLRAGKSRWRYRRKQITFLGLAAEHGLVLYLRNRLDKEPRLLNLYERPLLDFALMNNETSHYPEGPIRSDIIEMLLQRGVSPNQHYRDESVWVRFIQKLRKEHGTALDIYPGDLVDVLEMLILHGAIRETKIEISKTRQEGPVAMRSGRRLAEIQVVHQTALQVCAGTGVLSQDELTHLEGLIPLKAQEGVLSWLSSAVGWTR